MRLIKLYQPFFDANNWAHVLISKQDWMMILTLILMECLLSTDNTVVLAAQTQVLPAKDERRKPLVCGLWGAYLFYFIVIGVGTYLINFWEIKLLDGLYLLYLVYKYFYDLRHPVQVAKKGAVKKEAHKKKSSRTRKHHLSLFWRAVIPIELMDIVFSIDSVLAALAMPSNPVVVLVGGMIGILCIRGVAEIIIKLMEIIPGFQIMVHVLITITAVRLLVSLPPLNFKPPDAIFAGIVFGTVILTTIFHYARQNLHSKKMP